MAVAKNGYILCMADKELQKDKELLILGLHAKSNARAAFRCADKSLKKDKKILFEAMENVPFFKY